MHFVIIFQKPIFLFFNLKNLLFCEVCTLSNTSYLKVNSEKMQTVSTVLSEPHFLTSSTPKLDIDPVFHHNRRGKMSTNREWKVPVSVQFGDQFCDTLKFDNSLDLFLLQFVYNCSPNFHKSAR